MEPIQAIEPAPPAAARALPELLRVEQLSKSFGSLAAVRDVSFSVRGGEIVGLLGPNGAGKTTCLRCIASILQPTAGRVILNGHELAQEPLEARRALAFVPELPNLYELLTVWEHVQFIVAAYGGTLDPELGEELLRRLDLLDRRRELVGRLSKGMKQKLACVCAFAHRPPVYCFDEPLIGMDPRGAREFKDLLLDRRAAGDAVLVSTHMLDTAERLCDRVLIMHRGQLFAEGTLEELHARASMASGATLEDVFLRLTGEDA